jgi:hypothetical protein
MKHSRLTGLQEGQRLLPKLFGELRERYATRPGGYTRVLRTEPRPYDQAPLAILELVDGKKDLRFAMTAATVARDRHNGLQSNELTLKNREKVTKFREGGEQEFDRMVDKIEERFGSLEFGAEDWQPPKKRGAWLSRMKARARAAQPGARPFTDEVEESLRKKSAAAGNMTLV